jgi:hypothetical protein
MEQSIIRTRCRSLTGAACLLLAIVAAPIGAIAQERSQTAPVAQGSVNLEQATQAPRRQEPVFIENRGQWDARAKFLLRSPGLDLWITNNGVVYDINRIERIEKKSEKNGPRISSIAETEGAIGRDAPQFKVTRTPVFITYEGASTHASAVGSGRLQEYHNYYIGSDHSKWASHVPLYSDARVQGLYTGIDAVFYLDGGRPRYDLVVAPGADPANIRMKVEGATKVSVGPSGALLISTTLGTVEQRELFAYQEIDGRKQRVSCAFVAGKDGSVRLNVGRCDRSRPLVIDPLVWSTYLGGSSIDDGTGIAVDGSGNIYVAGTTSSTGFPTTSGASQRTYGGGTSDAFVTKLTSSGAISYSTYLGGSGYDHGEGIAVDGSGNAYVTGGTDVGLYDVLFVTKLTSSGAISYSSIFGSFEEGRYGNDIAVDGSGNAYVTGTTQSAQQRNAFVKKLTPSGATSYSILLGGSDDQEGRGIAVDGSGNAYITGLTSSMDFPTTADAAQGLYGGNGDAFVTKVTSNGAISYSTYLGGSGWDNGTGIAIDGSGNAYISGFTTSADLPTLNASQGAKRGTVDAFATKLTSSGGISYSTYLGGSQDEWGIGIAVDGSGNAYISGYTGSSDFPMLNAVQGSYGGGNDAFVTRLTLSGAISYSTYLGGSDLESGARIAVNGSGNAYLTGYTLSTDFSTTASAVQGVNAGEQDAFVTELSIGASPISNVRLTAITPYCANLSTTPIIWTSTGVSSVDIDFSTDNGANWTSIITGQTSGTTGGGISWKMPTSVGSHCRVRVSDASSSSASTMSAEFIISTPPIVTIPPISNSPVCPGTLVTFSAYASGAPAQMQQWQRSTNGGGSFTDITGETSERLTISSPTSSMNGYLYRAVFTTDCSSATSRTAILSVNTPPTVATDPISNAPVCPGTSVGFFAVANGTPTPTVRWERSTNGTSFTDMGITSHTLTISSPTSSMNGYLYRAVFSNSCGSATSSAATLTVNAPPAVTTNPGSNIPVCPGTSVTFSAAASGTPALGVRWQLSTDNGSTFANISGATSTSLTISSPTVSMNGNRYRAVFSNSCGSATSNAATLFVGPRIAVSPTALDFGWIAVGSSSDLNVTVSNPGSCDLHISSTSISGTNASEYTTLNGGSLTLASGGSRRLSVRFTPTTPLTVPRTATLTIASDDPSRRSATVSLTGKGGPTEVTPFLMLADDRIRLDGQDGVEGDLHSNDEIEIRKGNPTTLAGILTAVGGITIAEDNTIDGDVAAGGQLDLDLDATITGTATGNALVSPVSIDALSYTCGTSDRTVSRGSSLSLGAGSYGKIKVEDSATLTLSSGSYFAETLELKKGAMLTIHLTDGPVTINVMGKVDFGEQSEVAITPAVFQVSRWLRINSRGSTLQIEKDARILGVIYAPDAQVTVKQNVAFKGSIVAHRITADKDGLFLFHSSTTPLSRPMVSSSIRPPTTGGIVAWSYPNPTSAEATITYRLPADGMTTVTIHDALGNEVKLLDRGQKKSGAQQVVWDGTASNGESVGAGDYFYRVESNGTSVSGQIVLVR